MLSYFFEPVYLYYIFTIQLLRNNNHLKCRGKNILYLNYQLLIIYKDTKLEVAAGALAPLLFMQCLKNLGQWTWYPLRILCSELGFSKMYICRFLGVKTGTYNPQNSLPSVAPALSSPVWRLCLSNYLFIFSIQNYYQYNRIFSPYITDNKFEYYA